MSSVGLSTGHSEERIGEFEGSSIETSQTEMQRENRICKNRTVDNCGTISKELTCVIRILQGKENRAEEIFEK